LIEHCFVTSFSITELQFSLTNSVAKEKESVFIYALSFLFQPFAHRSSGRFADGSSRHPFMDSPLTDRFDVIA